MSINLFLALTLGTALMLAVMLFCRKWYKTEIRKICLQAPILTVFGFISVKILFFIENGQWGGLSFFGAVFLIPFWFLAVARLLKLPYGEAMDLNAPSICMMLALMKINCLYEGCCQGKILHENAAGEPVRFPSQIVEMVNALAVMVILLYLMKNGKLKNRIYPCFMILYGVTRFFWNLFRETEPSVGNLAAGNFWAIISVVCGIGWLLAANCLAKKGAVYEEAAARQNS